MKYSAGRGVYELHNYIIHVYTCRKYILVLDWKHYNIHLIIWSNDKLFFIIHLYTQLIKSKYVNIYTN